MKRPPNILFVFPDQWRHDWSWQSELPLRLPFCQSVARRGLSFSHAVTPSPLCAPARACLATGREYEHCAVKSNSDDLDLDEQTFYQRLRETGYQVLGCGKYDLAKDANDWSPNGQHPLPDGTNRLDHWGFNGGADVSGKIDGVTEGARDNLCPYTSFLKSEGLLDVHIADLNGRRDYYSNAPTPLPDRAYLDNFVGQQAVDLLQGAGTQSPWFLQVNFCGPHSPMDTTHSMFDSVRGRTFGEPPPSELADPETRQNTRRAYAAMIENIDRWVGRMLQVIHERGEDEETLIVISSDHGDMLCDKGFFGKNLPYQASVGIPLCIAGPGVKATGTNDSAVSLIDLSATFLDYACGETPRYNDACSLRAILEGNARSNREAVFSGLGNWKSACDGRWKWITGYDTNRGFKQQLDAPQPVPDLLFDLKNDPAELNNIAAENTQKVEELKNCFMRHTAPA
ncbi:sulfatase-like hydrolase/transferase [Ruficoccus sp. ZRK36]|uniref:sulfatase family protein n=1 Tax=Ruficoccus sp. ZRK36 TaxID=2866311 RepID=UPI001C73A7AC|nr:sulfatase-like hydrolase/transferase [Ruficoccus sp. ZRK36]QYY34309.1 sulfatase-like hydrolase/transferase [Ruficoccus sp. ZRK36]